ncbi:MAG: ABC transporter permease [Chitinophagales bacterium]
MNLFTIVWDGLRRRRIRTALAVAGIAIAATALFSLVSLKRGYEAGMRAELDNMGAQVVAVAKGCPYEAIAVIMIGGQVPATLPETVVARIRAVPNVASASPNVYGAYDYLNLSHPLVGITRDELRLKSWWRIKGRFPERFGEVMLGGAEASAFASKGSEYRKLGDSFTVTAGGRPARLTVVGVLEKTGAKDDYTTYTTLETAQKLLGLEGRVVAVNLRVKDLMAIPETIEGVEAIPDVQAVTVAQVLGTIQNLVRSGQGMLFTVMLIALVIGGLGTMNTMLMTVFERTREIGLMKAIGATPGQIFRIFLVEGLLICAAGGLLGVVAGGAATLAGDVILKQFVSIMPTRPVGQLSWVAAGVSLLFPLGVGLVASLYPAWRAARQSPIAALRSE